MRKTVLVTGGSQGIGRAIVARFAARAWSVALLDVDRDGGRDAEQEYGAEGNVRFFEADVADEDAAGAGVSAALETFGRLDALVNNAGISRAGGRPLEELALADWNRVLAVNLTSAMLMSRAAEKHLRRNRGSIVNIASTRALQSEPNTFAYSASKGGLVALTHAMAVSLGPAIRVNVVCPGWIATDEWRPRGKRRSPELTEADHRQHPCGRVGTPEDIAALVWFLASGEAGFLTGQSFVADGGMTRRMIYV